MIKLRRAIFILIRINITVAISVGLMASAVAQQPAASPAAAPQVDQNGNLLPAKASTASAERVIVTGSNIPTAEEVGPNPVDTYGRDQINKSGLPTTEQFLRDLPISNANGVAISNNENGSNTAVGAAAVALHGFDSRATLILLDGRRITPYPFGNNPGLFSNAMFVDLNSIPQAAIESIEILKDGASTTYGADAVAGVVNIKLRHMYDGALATIEYGNSTRWDSDEFSTSLLYGVGDAKTSIVGVVNYYHRNPIANRDRAFSRRPPFLSSNASPYNLQLSSDVAGAAGGMNLNPGGLEFSAAPDFTNGSAPASAYKYGLSRLNHFNFNKFSLSFPESERYGLWLRAERKLFDDQMVVYADGFYQNVKAHNELAPPATGSFQTKGQTILAIPPNMPIAPGAEPPNTPTHADTGVPADAFNPFNPFNQIISGGTRARLAEFGNRLFDNETDAWLSTLGIKGDKLFDGSWGYDAGFRYSQIKNVQTGQQVSASLFNRILNQADPIFNPASSQFIGTTTPFNPFGDFRVPIPSNQATVAFATVHPKDEDISKLATLDGTIYSTDLYDLPAGGLGFAVGGQFRRETLEENPDRLNVLGDIVGNSPVQPVRGGRKSFAFYGELKIPIFSPTNAIPGFRSFEFTASTRFEDFENNDTNVLVPKVGVRWQPFDEQLTLRATWGEGFREPSLEELYSAPVSTLEVSHDPLKGGLFESETNVLISSNRNLQPEDSRSFSGGFVYTPKYAPGLTFNADFWDIERTGVVFAPTADQVLLGGAPGTVERDAGGFITRILVANENFGAQTARGVDLGLQYQRETQFGTFTSLTQVTHLYEFFFPLFSQGFPGEFHGNLAGTTTDPGASNEGWYRWKGNERVDWTWKGVDFNMTVRYTDGFKEHKPDAVTAHYVKQTFFFDGQLSYDFTALLPVQSNPVAGESKNPKDVTVGKDGRVTETAEAQTANFESDIWTRLLRGTVITIGCNNLFDQDPPKAFGEGGNGVGYPGFTYDATGRFAYIRLMKKF